MTQPVPFQRDLFGGTAVSIDDRFNGMVRIQLDANSWVDHLPGWVSGADILFEQVAAARTWKQRTRWMFDGSVLEPRLTSVWLETSGEALCPDTVDTLRRCLSHRYGVAFDSVGFNLYRGGADSVAWHRDHIQKSIDEPIVPLVSLGEPRRFLLRPEGGGGSRAFCLGRGDLLVTGGKTQRTWEHCVPKVARAGPRLSLAFRRGMDLSVYEQ